jgi:hypothetical protein
MKDKTQDKDSFPQSNTVDGKDRRRFLKKMAVCAIVAPAITILPQRFAAASSGDGCGDRSGWDRDRRDGHRHHHGR